MKIQIFRFVNFLVGLDVLHFHDHEVQRVYGTVSHRKLQVRDAAEGTHRVAVGANAYLAGQRSLYSFFIRYLLIAVIRFSYVRPVNGGYQQTAYGY